MKTNPTICIAHTSQVYAYGLYELLSSEGFEVIFNLKNATELMPCLSDNVDVIIAEDRLLNELEVSLESMLNLETSKIKFIQVGEEYNSKNFKSSIEYKIYGYLFSIDSFETVLECVYSVIKGQQYVSPTFKFEETSQSIINLNTLSETEVSILQLISEQKKSQDIAEKLLVSIRTIEKHRSNIIKKLELSSQTNSLTNWAISNKDFIKNLNLRIST